MKSTFAPYLVAVALSSTGLAQTSYLDFDPLRRIEWDGGSQITYNLWQWQFNPNTNQIFAYTNGVLDPSRTEVNGTANINLVSAWTIQPDANAVKVGVVDDFTGNHGWLVRSIIEQITRSTNIHNFQTDYSRQQTAEAFTNAVNAGCRVINYSSGDTQNPKPTNLLASIARAGDSNVLVCVAALNGYGSEDLSRDWIPNELFQHVLTVNSFDKEGRLWYSAHGTNVTLSAPGRRVLVFVGTNAYSSSGTCHATAHVTGAAALIMARYPEEESFYYAKGRIRSGVDKTPLIGTNLFGGTLNVYRALIYNPTAPCLTIDRQGVSLSVPSYLRVRVMRSNDLSNWAEVEADFIADGFPHQIALFTTGNGFYKVETIVE